MRKQKIYFSIFIVLSLLFSACSPISKPSVTNSQANFLTVHTIDVGQGDSTLILSPSGKSMLIDAGDNDAGPSVVSYLQNFGIKKIDVLIATHPDADHIGGIDLIIDTFEIGEFYMPKRKNNSKSYKDVLHAAHNKNLYIHDALAGMRPQFDDNVAVLFLSPYDHAYMNNNEFSIATYLRYKEISFLFMGDCDTWNEEEILSHYPNLHTDFLKLGHHGSKNSTSETFLNTVSPSVVSISCGYKNQFFHPHKRVMNLLSQYSIPVYRTDEQKDIRFFCDGKHLFTDKKAPASYEYPK